MKSELTMNFLISLKPGQWASDLGARGTGQLQARRLSSGSLAFYYRYTDSSHKQVRIPLGANLSLPDARAKAASLSRLYQDGEHDLRSALQTKSSKTTTRVHDSFGALLNAYVCDLRYRGKTSAREVENALILHVHNAWPIIWEKTAASITMDDLLLLISHVANQGKLREAGKLRGYIRAAYATAIRARQDALGLPALQALRINSNPARDLATVRGASKTRERVLSLDELRFYWKCITIKQHAGNTLLQFHLLTGAQRLKQLARATTNDYDHDTQTLRLYDPKGRRINPRAHIVPLIPAAQEVMKNMQGGTKGPYLWTVTCGTSGAWYTTASNRLKEVIQEMTQENPRALPGGPFTLGDLRRTVETRLAGIGVSREIRAQLQSHGLSGVQIRHYNRYDYLEEKKAALMALYQLLK